jgi:hypothetical protein
LKPLLSTSPASGFYRCLFFSALSFSPSVEMAAKARCDDSPHVSPHDSPDLGSQQSYVVPTHDTLALVVEQMALIKAHLDAQSAAAGAAHDVVDHATDVAEPLVAKRRRDAQLE